MDKFDLCVTIIVGIILIITIFVCVADNMTDDTEKIKYKDNIIVKDMSIKMFNKPYKECSYTEKQEVLREYRLRTYYDQQRTEYFPIFLPI